MRFCSKCLNVLKRQDYHGIKSGRPVACVACQKPDPTIEILNPRLAETLDLEMIRRETGAEIRIQPERRDLEMRKPDVIDETWKERAKALGYNVL